jgi:hypothetical protein
MDNGQLKFDNTKHAIISFLSLKGLNINSPGRNPGAKVDFRKSAHAENLCND